MSENVQKNFFKEMGEFFFELIKSPMEFFKKRHKLTWTQILVYLASVSYVMMLVPMLLSGFMIGLLYIMIPAVIMSLIYQGILFFVATLILKKKQIQIDNLELAQAWLKGAILGVVVGMLVAWIPSPDNLGFILNLLPAAITAYAVYCYYNHKNASDQKQSKFTAMVVGCALAIIPILTSAGMSIGERSLRRQMMSNKVDYLSIDNIEKKYSEEGKVENKFDVLVKKYAGNDKNKVGLIKYLGFSYAVLADDLGVEGYESLQFALKCVTFHFPNEEQKIKKEVFDLYINTSEKKANWAHFESSLTARDIQNIKEEVSQMNPKSSCNHF